ncbi:MAG TPA: ATP-binding cassette domain-containing protein, partial [Solirubrobacterales bacterium]|nr:ATP-binding cassette domain-containing protein [Solirubrobacterales bacterium]
EIRADQPVEELSIDVQQRVEILKLLYLGADVLILDEPTAVLGPVETEKLFETLRALAERGATVVIITHKLREVMSIASRVTVMRHGVVVGRAEKGEFSEDQLAEEMLGHALPSIPAPADRAPGDVALRTAGLWVRGDRGETAIEGIDLELRGGEIVGLAGVEGNGQVELCQALSGLRKPSDGSIEVLGRDLTGGGPADFSDSGVGVITEDRLRWDVIVDLSLADNLALSAIRSGRYSRAGFLRKRAIRRDAEQLLKEYDVRPPDPTAPMLSLSGGNQQKVVIARECSAAPKVLIASHPTRGLDVGASGFVAEQLVKLRDGGCAVLLNSTDLDELMEVCDRIVALYRGRILLSAPVHQLDIASIARAITGSGA